MLPTGRTTIFGHIPSVLWESFVLFCGIQSYNLRLFPRFPESGAFTEVFYISNDEHSLPSIQNTGKIHFFNLLLI